MMKKQIIVFLLLLPGLALGQTSTAKTNVGSLPSPVNKPTSPSIDSQAVGANINQINSFTPFLTADVAFKDSSGQNILGADDNAEILVTLKNIGGKPAKDCRVELVPSVESPEITITNPSVISQILPNQQLDTHIFLKGSHYISTGNAQFTLKVLEKNGFDLDPEKVLVIPTLAFQPPKVELVDYGVQDPNRTGKIQKREIVTVTLRLQNKGLTTSYVTTATITLGDNVLPIQVDSIYNMGDMKPGDYKDVNATIVTNDRATEVKMDIAVKDRSGENTFSKTLELPFDTPQKKVQEIVIAANKTEGPVIPNVADLKLDIGENIPVAAVEKPNAVAVIIGNRDYTNAPGVDYALNDAAIVKRYVLSAMGYKPGNVIYLENATQGDLIGIFGNETNYQGKLYDYVRKGLSEVFIYYSGHGAPDPNSKEGYIVPVDCDPSHVALNGYSLKTLYSNLDKIDQEKQLTHVAVVLDACFSGASVNGTLLANISPIYITVHKDVMVDTNATIITSATGDQVSGWYSDKRQSLFTYFLLKGLQGAADYQHNKAITAKELYEFTADEVNGVPYWSRRLNSKTQTPTFYGSDWTVYDGKK
ncbi:MAG TPA: caspase family protein [Candidatus Kryptonia bacterium]